MKRNRNYLLSTHCWPANNDGGQGGDGGTGDGGQGGGPNGGGSNYTPPSTQEELNELVERRLQRERSKYGMSAEEAQQYKTRVGELEHDLGSETDKAVSTAKAEAEKETAAKFAPRLVTQAFKAEAKGVLTKEQLDSLLEDLDLSKYLTNDGDVDEEKVTKKVSAFAPAKDEGNGRQQRRDLGQGPRKPADAKPGDAGRAAAQKRFGAKQTQSA
jgi:hypothetical protein